MSTGIKVTKGVETWMCGLGRDGFARVVGALDLLATHGSGLGRPLVNRVYGRGGPALKELRPSGSGKAELRVLFSFDADGYAVLLEAGGTSTRCCGRHTRDTNVSTDAVERMARVDVFDWDEIRGDLDVDEDVVAGHRARMLAEVVGLRLAEIRKSRQLIQKDVARSIGVRWTRVARIEDGGIGHAELDTVRSYIEALGGRLLMRAEFDDQPVLLC